MKTDMIYLRHRRVPACFFTVLIMTALTFTPALAAQFTYTPDLTRNSVALEGLIPTKRFMNIALPSGSIEFVDGTLAVNIVPNWSFDRVPVLQGPIIRTEASTNGKEGLVSGVVLFTQGYWFDRYWTPGSQETVTTNAGVITTGRISDMTATTLTVTTAPGAQVIVPLADIKELHSPRAYAFVAPVVASAAIPPDQAWTGNVPAVTLAPTVASSAGPVVANVRRDPLLNMKDEGDWSNRKLWVIGTALSLAELSQLVPYVVLPMFSHQFWQHLNKKAFFTQTNPIPSNPAPLVNGNTYTLPVPFNASH